MASQSANKRLKAHNNSSALSTNQTINKSSVKSHEAQQKLYGHLSNELNSMFNNPEFSDFTFTVNGVIYYAHKCVLSARSPVFAAMFRSNMCETQTNNMVIDDCNSHVFEQLLKYIYTGDVSDVKQLAFELFPIADKYETIELKKHCENSIQINNDNAIKVLIMAYLHNSEKLKKKAVDYIVNNLRVIRSTFNNEFKQLVINYPLLVCDIFDAIEKKHYSKSVNTSAVGEERQKKVDNRKPLLITRLDGEVFRVEVEPHDSILELKFKIEEQQYLRAFTQKLYYMGELLADHRKVSLIKRDPEDDCQINWLYLRLKDRIGISVKIESLISLCFEVNPCGRVDQIKRMIKAKENIRILDQTLMFNGILLDNNRALNYYNIADGSTLEMRINFAITIRIDRLELILKRRVFFSAKSIKYAIEERNKVAMTKQQVLVWYDWRLDSERPLHYYLELYRKKSGKRFRHESEQMIVELHTEILDDRVVKRLRYNWNLSEFRISR